VHLGPAEAAATALLAWLHLLLLLAATVAAASWLLLGAPDLRCPGARLMAAAAARLLPRLRVRTAPGVGPEGGARRQARADPAAAFRRLRYLSLRRSSLSGPVAAAAGGAGLRGGAASVMSLLLWPLPAAISLRSLNSAAGRHECSGSAGGECGASTQQPSATDSRRRACAAGGAALLQWVLPRACAAAQLAGSALAALGLSRFAPCAPSHRACSNAHGSKGCRVARPRKPPQARPPLQSLLLACNELRFVDLTCVGGGAAAPGAMSRLVRALWRGGHVHYIAVAQPARLRLERRASSRRGCGNGGSGDGGGGYSHAEDEGGDHDRGSDDSSSGCEDECCRAWEGRGSGGGRARAGHGWLRWLGRGSSSGGGSREGTQDPAWRGQRSKGTGGVAPPAPILLECSGFDEIIVRELGL
ncbi:hypothetical protein MNEG_12531, partial [Monoraphidium neglectum]